jgi:hypothetical protein
MGDVEEVDLLVIGAGETARYPPFIYGLIC